ncbi:filamentous hemagglutinin N-terminal domain-containing protein [Salmonella enterica subsp. enterica serovar Eastbourne]|nr:filamentous hemagglutinin N-terminal domain-containing protein [Salmonella enterica subsp. enterica serovar Eastbourne]
MNKIYKLKFDKRRNELVVVSEITAGMGKEKSTGYLADLSALSPFRKLLGRLTPVALLTGLISGLLPAMALAADLPTGGQIVGGQGSITTSGNQMTIHQQTHNMATDWHSFDVGKNNTVQFVQPDSSSVALNRVTGASGSQIMGTLKANGQVFILNPNGVLFGKDARVNVAGLVASTKNIDTADFMKGQYTFSGSGNPGSQVVNQGSLTTSKGGYIVLAGERVSNSGSITTPSGKTVLAAGKTVTLQLDNDGLTSVSVNGSVVNALVENRGLVSATNGQVYLTAKGQDMLLNTVVNNTGTLEAKGLESHGGKIVLNGGNSGVVNQAGQMLADSQAGRGGEITLEGQNIHLAAGSRTSATGKTGGGEVYVGGGWQGKDSRIRNASGVVMDKSAILDVSATGAGNGGTAVLWSDDYTNFRGGILARGGALSGDGGRVETSSHHNLQAYGSVDASAHSGHRGEWLLDPTNVTIVGSGTDTGVASVTADGTDIFTPSASGAQILNSSIVTQLTAGTNVTIKTSGMDFSGQSGDITVNAPVSVSTGDKTASLALQADNNIRFNPAGTVNVSGSSAVDLDLKAGKNIYLLSNISLNGGNLTIGGMTEQSPSPHVDSWNNGTNSPVLNVGNFSAILSNGQSSANGDFHFWSTKLNATHDINITVSSTPNTNAISLEGNWDITAGGDITLNGGRGNISLKTGNLSSSAGSIMLATDGTVTLSNPVKIQAQQDTNITGNSLAFDSNVQLNTTAGNVTLNLKPGSGGTVRWNGGSISAGNDVLISAASSNQWGPLNLTNPNISATKNITLTATPLTGSNSGSSLGIIGGNLTAGANLTLNGGQSNTGNINDGVSLSGTTLTAEAVNISGVTKNNNLAGVNLANVIMNAKDASVYGESQGRGTAVRMNKVTLNNTHTNISAHSLNGSQSGFNLSNITLGTNQTLANLNLSSAGSAQNAVNILDGSLFMNPAVEGQAVTVDETKLGDLLKKNIENTTQIDMNGVDLFNSSDKGWVSNYRSAGGWAFKNTRVIAGGDVDLYNASFTDSTLNITNGNLNITNTGNVLLTGTDITANDGGVSIHSTEGSIGLNRGNISAKNDINLTADNGTLSISGKSKESVVYVTSTTGNVSLKGLTNDIGNSGLFLNNSTVNSENGHILITGTKTADSLQVYYNTNFHGAVEIQGNVFLKSKQTTVNAYNTYEVQDVSTSRYNPAIALYFTPWASLSLTGNSSINSIAQSGAGVLFAAPAVQVAAATINVTNGNLNWLSVTGNAPDTTGYSTGAFAFGNGYAANRAIFNLINANVDIIADASGSTLAPIPGFAGQVLSDDFVNGFAFNGSGNVSIKGISSGGDGVMTHYFTNENLKGSFTVKGESIYGNGVNLDNNLDAHLINATITGESYSGTGVSITARGQGSVNLDGNTINGWSSTAAGIVISGNNVTVSNGRLNGTSDSNSGVSMEGGSNYTIAGVHILGISKNGNGITAAGNLALNNNTTLQGSATGAGSGVAVSGNMESTDGVVIKGSANSGSGVSVSGSTTLNNATVSGEAISGTGVNIEGMLVTDDNTVLSGSSSSGSGITMKDANVTGVRLSGTSSGGTGLSISGNSTATDSTIAGSTTDGTGVDISGNLNNNNTTITGVANGTGNGAKLSGNLTGVRLSGTSSGRTGLSISGNSTATDSTIAGSTTDGTGVDISGNLINNNTTITGVANGAGNGAKLSGNLTGTHPGGTKVVGRSTKGSAVLITDGAQIDGVKVLGRSLDGPAIKTDGQVSVTGSQLIGNSVNSADLDVSGTLSHDQDTAIDADIVTGQENIREVKPVPPLPVAEEGNTSKSEANSDRGRGHNESLSKQVEVNSAVNTQVTQMNRVSQDGFHPAGTPPVPVKGYRPAERMVDISLCDGNDCQSESLYVGKPAEIRARTSG